jgi:hypothetical protein
MQITNAGGQRTLTITQDSAGVSVSRTYWDSAGAMVLKQVDTLRQLPADTALQRRMREAAARQDSMAARMQPLIAAGGPTNVIFSGGSLVSGIASIPKTIADHKAGTIFSYRDIIAMTKLDGWK